MFTEASAAIFIGLAMGQLMRFQGSLRDLSIAMANAEANERKPIDYQNAMTPRWLVAGVVTLLAVLVYVFAQHVREDGLVSGLSDILFFVGGLLISKAISTLARFPSTELYLSFAMSALRNRETGADSTQSAEMHAHFQRLLLSLAGQMNASRV